jgi:ribonuclease BN (tRNA processing enzyme)
MRLTVLGKSPSWEDAGGACSSYLIEESSTAVLLDCGSGALGKLRVRIDYRDLDAIVISHFHADHLLDLVPLAAAFTYGPASSDGSTAPRLIAPVGAERFFRGLEAAIDAEGLIVGAFPIEEYEPSSEITVGGVVVRSHPVPHIGPTHAIELTERSGGRIVFGADGRYSDELIAAARDAELLLAEATLADPDQGDDVVHMSAAEAGRLAREAGVERLVLTHISDELDLERARSLAAEAFGGPVEVASEGATYEVL